MQINLSDARTCLPRLVAAVELGEEVIFARNGKPVAKIVRYEETKIRSPGSMRGRIKVSPDWNSPEPNAEIAELLGGLTRLDSSGPMRS